MLIPPFGVATEAPTDLEWDSFTANGSWSGHGNASTVTERGFAWFQGTVGDPLTSDNTVFETGTFDGTIPATWSLPFTELTEQTSYQVRAYAINSEGTSYGETITVTTPERPLDRPSVAGRSATPSRSVLVLGTTEVDFALRSATPTRTTLDVHVVTPEVLAGRSATPTRAAIVLGFEDFNPANLQIVIVDDTVHLAWDSSPGDVIDYLVFRRTPQTGEPFDPASDTPVATVDHPTTAYDDEGLAPFAYDWQVYGRVRG